MTVHDFTGQTVIVTGGTRGIGKAVSQAFLKAGAKVIANYSSNEVAADQFKQENVQYGDRLDLQKFNVASYEEVEKFYKYVEEKYGSFEVLVSNAGIRKDSVLGMMKEADWRAVVDVNLNGNFNMCKFAVMSMMRKRYGRIIVTTSPMGRFGWEGQSNYAASKAGQVGLVRSLAKEVATRGITVNCVSPGFIATEFIGDLTEKVQQAYQSLIPMRRLGKAEEVAACVLFLASKEASYVSGATLEVGGGL
jgi:3-oxoacyl-[acyl-carrier protein] reductase